MNGGPARMAFVEPGVNRAAHFFQLARKEMVGAFDDDEALRFEQRGAERFDIRARAELIVSALDNEFRFRAIAQVRQI